MHFLPSRQKQQRRHTYTFTGHPYPLHIMFAASESAWLQLLKPLGISLPYPNSFGRASSFVRAGFDPLLIITFSDKTDSQDPNQIVALMAHELAHVIQFIEESTETRLDSETEAYMMQAMLLWLMEAYTASGRSFGGGSTSSSESTP